MQKHFRKMHPFLASQKTLKNTRSSSAISNLYIHTTPAYDSFSLYTWVRRMRKTTEPTSGILFWTFSGTIRDKHQILKTIIAFYNIWWRKDNFWHCQGNHRASTGKIAIETCNWKYREKPKWLTWHTEISKQHDRLFSREASFWNSLTFSSTLEAYRRRGDIYPPRLCETYSVSISDKREVIMVWKTQNYHIRKNRRSDTPQTTSKR